MSCNFIRHNGYGGVIDQILQQDSVHVRSGMVITDQVVNYGAAAGVGTYNELEGGRYFPVGPCVNITGGVSHQLGCSSKGTVSLWQSPSEDECVNPQLIALEHSNAFSMVLGFTSRDSAVNCGEDQGCGYVYAQSDDLRHGGTANLAKPGSTVWLGIPNICMSLRNNYRNHWERCGLSTTTKPDATCTKVVVHDTNNTPPNADTEEWFCPASVACTGGSGPGQDTGMIITCDGNGAILTIKEYPRADCTGLWQDWGTPTMLANLDTVCVESADMSTFSTLPDVDPSNANGMMASSAPSVKGWMLTALATAATMAVFAM